MKHKSSHEQLEPSDHTKIIFIETGPSEIRHVPWIPIINFKVRFDINLTIMTILNSNNLLSIKAFTGWDSISKRLYQLILMEKMKKTKIKSL